MLLRSLYILSIVIFITACNKESRFKVGNIYVLQGTGSYGFDSGYYTAPLLPVELELTNSSRHFLGFKSNTSSQNLLSFEIHKQNKVIGHWVLPTTGHYDVVFEGEIVKENGKKGIVGEMSFTFIHEYLIYDGPYTYPGSAPVTATGPFEITSK